MCAGLRCCDRLTSSAVFGVSVGFRNVAMVLFNDCLVTLVNLLFAGAKSTQPKEEFKVALAVLLIASVSAHRLSQSSISRFETLESAPVGGRTTRRPGTRLAGHRRINDSAHFQ